MAHALQYQIRRYKTRISGFKLQTASTAMCDTVHDNNSKPVDAPTPPHSPFALGRPTHLTDCTFGLEAVCAKELEKRAPKWPKCVTPAAGTIGRNAWFVPHHARLSTNWPKLPCTAPHRNPLSSIEHLTQRCELRTHRMKVDFAPRHPLTCQKSKKTRGNRHPSGLRLLFQGYCSSSRARTMHRKYSSWWAV